MASGADSGGGASRRGSAAWAVAIALAAASYPLRRSLGDHPLVPSEPIVALVLGMVLGQVPVAHRLLASGAKRASKAAIPFAIVLIGFGLDARPLLESGSILSALGVTVALMAVAFLGAAIGARAAGVGGRTAVLLGAGTAVCGNSAIMAVAPAISPDDEELGLSLGVINLLGVVMLFALPPFAASIGIDGAEGGRLAGLTVHAVPQAIATGGVFGAEAEAQAALYKLLRVALLVPVVVLVSAFARRRGVGGEGRAKGGVPLFVILFVLAAAARAAGLVDFDVAGAAAHERAKWAGRFALGVALAAIGLGLDVRALVRVGPRVLLAAVVAVAAMVAAAVPLLDLLAD